MAQVMHAVDLSFSQLSTLFRLSRHGSLRIGDLAQGAHLSPCATSRFVARLVTDGLVEKHPNPENRRERLVVLTEQGSAYLERLRRCSAQAYDDLFLNVPSDLKERLLDTFAELKPLIPQERSA